jgi:hypothetical protein
MTTDNNVKAAIPNDPVSNLMRWLDHKPESADTLRVYEVKLVHNELVVEYSASEIDKMSTAEVAESILDECEVWAESKNKITPFIIQWYSENREVKSRHVKITPSSVNGVGMTGLPQPDGSLESLIAGMQSAAIRKDQILINMMESVVGLFLQLVEHMSGRINHLESQEIEVRRLKGDLLELSAGADEDMGAKVQTFMSLFTKAIEAAQATKDAAKYHNPNPRSNP